MERITVAVKITEDLRKRVRIYCVKNGVKIQDFVARAFESELKKRGDA